MRIILAAILTAAIATPAAAHYSKRTDNVIIKKMHRSADAYAYAPLTQRYARTQNVYVHGSYAGTDPDWFIRESLRQEAIGGSGSDK